MDRGLRDLERDFRADPSDPRRRAALISAYARAGQPVDAGFLRSGREAARGAAAAAIESGTFKTGTAYEVVAGDGTRYQVRLDTPDGKRAYGTRTSRIYAWNSPDVAWDHPPYGNRGDNAENDKGWRKYNREEIRLQRVMIEGALTALGITLTGTTPSARLPYDANAGCSSCSCSPGFTRPVVAVREGTRARQVDICVARVAPCDTCGEPRGFGCQGCNETRRDTERRALAALVRGGIDGRMVPVSELPENFVDALARLCHRKKKDPDRPYGTPGPAVSKMTNAEGKPAGFRLTNIGIKIALKKQQAQKATTR